MNDEGLRAQNRLVSNLHSSTSLFMMALIPLLPIVRTSLDLLNQVNDSKICLIIDSTQKIRVKIDTQAVFIKSMIDL